MRSTTILMASGAVVAAASARFADFLSNETPVPAKPVGKRPGNAQGGRQRRVLATFTLASQAIGDRLMLPRIPKGSRGVKFDIQSSVALGGVATLAIGITGNTGKYRAAAIKNDTANEVVKSALITAAELAADEDPFITVGAAALPAAGTLAVEMIYNV